MRTESLQGPPIVAASAAIAAFQVAVVQQKQFEETLERVSDKQEEMVKESARSRDRADDVVDVRAITDVAESSDSGNTKKDDVAAASDVGSKVNILV